MNCTLYLVRHGVAGPPPPGMGDAERELTPSGARKVIRIARGLKRLGVTPEHVVSSRLARAEQTATLLARGLVPGCAVETVDWLAPGSTPATVLRGLQVYRGAQQIVLVAHQPDMGELASQLLTGSPSLTPLPFKKGAVAAVVVSGLPPRSDGELLWFLTPRQLRLIGR